MNNKPKYQKRAVPYDPATGKVIKSLIILSNTAACYFSWEEI